MLQRTPLYDLHVSCGAKMVDFAGWEMPLMYRGIVEEHLYTRSAGSLFDVSHMGRLQIRGDKATAFLNQVLTRNVESQKVGQSRYSLVCNAGGGVLDDVIVSRDTDHWLIVCNASNRTKILSHLLAQRDAGNFPADIIDQTVDTAMVALQGPKVLDHLAGLLTTDPRKLSRYGFERTKFREIPFTLFRSGYTGEDGAEIITPAASARALADALAPNLASPDALIRPAGLGARDTLRLEAAMPLYGHELSEAGDPISAGLTWAVDLKKDFLGAEPLRVIAQRGPARKLVGLEITGPRIARQGATVTRGPMILGQVTSGTSSPTLKKSIALAYLDAHASSIGETVEIDLRGTHIAAAIVALPFFKRK